MEKFIKVWLKYYPVYLSGLWGTLWISAVTVLLGALLGMVIALVRMSKTKVLKKVVDLVVDRGQWEAARSIGLSETHVLTRVILPQAIKNILPALCNEFISTVKGTSLASVFFVGELMTSYKTVQSATFLALQSLTIAGIIYFLLNYVLSRLLKVIERRLTVSD